MAFSLDTLLEQSVVAKTTGLLAAGVLSWAGLTLVNDHLVNAEQNVQIFELQRQGETIDAIKSAVGQIQIDTARVEERTRIFLPDNAAIAKLETRKFESTK